MSGQSQFLFEEIHRAALAEVERQSDAYALVREVCPPRPGVCTRLFCRAVMALGRALMHLGQRLQEVHPERASVAIAR